jgi:hypothetical protein
VTDRAEEILRRGYRVIRLVTGEPDSPWPGALVCDPSGETSLLVDAALVGDDWDGWKADPTGHVLAPLDILRRPDGHEILLPVCTERLGDFLDRRSGELSIGEGVTVAVSLLRGLSELKTREQAPCGSWWLTESGRPVFATDTAPTPAEAETEDLLRRLSTDLPPLEPALREALGAASDPRRRTREFERAEEDVFAVAEPTALATSTLGPKRARGRLPVDPVLAPAARADGDAPSWALSLSRHLDADWADLVSRTTTGVWRALRDRRAPGRRRPVLAAGGIAAVVLIGGLLWPSGGGGPATAETAQSPTRTTPSPSSAVTPSADAPPAGKATDAEKGADRPEPAGGEDPTDLASIAAALLTARSACAGDADCLAGVLERSDAAFPAGVVDLPDEERTTTLLDEFGGAAVLRVDHAAGAATAQLVVIVSVDGRWLLRDVHDVAER